MNDPGIIGPLDPGVIGPLKVPGRTLCECGHYKAHHKDYPIGRKQCGQCSCVEFHQERERWQQILPGTAHWPKGWYKRTSSAGPR